MIYDPSIKIMVEKLKKRMEGGKIYGFPIDPDNPDLIIFAAYHIGYHDAYESTERLHLDEMGIMEKRGK